MTWHSPEVDSGGRGCPLLAAWKPAWHLSFDNYTV